MPGNMFMPNLYTIQEPVWIVIFRKRWKTQADLLTNQIEQQR